MSSRRLRSGSRRPLATWASVAAVSLLCAARAMTSSMAPQSTAFATWPLGPDGSVARELYSTHYQFWQWTFAGASVDLVHQGIDISGCAREPVYAVEDGTVVFSNFRDSKVDGQYKELIVSRGPDDTKGIRYLHLGGTTVTVGDKVVRDQLLGTVVDWLDPCSFDHLHVQVVTPNDTSWSSGSPWPDKATLDVVNPLTVFNPAADKLLPSCTSVTSTIGSSSVEVLFYKDGNGAELDPGGLQKPVDVVASLRDLCFDEPAVCGASASGCSEAISKFVAPYRLTLGISEIDASSGVEGQIQRIASVTFESGITASAAELIARYYHPDTVGTHAERDLRFNLTNSADGGAWSPADGVYRIYVSAEDLAGNAYLVPVKQVTVKNPP